tara:strand:- start:95 stop:541 length:447 start_codon:yes stop_codon:yes gene_type:complete
LVLAHLEPSLLIILLIIFPKYWAPDFPIKYLPSIFTYLFYFAYLTLVYKRAKSKDGFIQTKRFIMKKEKIYSVIKLADLILSKFAYYLIPIFILCICAIFVDSVIFFGSMGYESLGVGIKAIKICIILLFIYLWRYLIKKAFRFQSND